MPLLLLLLPPPSPACPAHQTAAPRRLSPAAIRYLQGNGLTGGVPPVWGGLGMALLRFLFLANNPLGGACRPRARGARLAASTRPCTPSSAAAVLSPTLSCPLAPLPAAPAGKLPVEWGLNGSFPELKTLDLNSTGLTGTLPPSWGTPGAMPSLDAL